MHWGSRKQYKEYIEWCTFEKSPLHELQCFKKATVTFDIYFKTKRRRDVANYLGGGLIAWLDALVSLCVIADDSYDCIGQPIVNFHINKKNPRTEITIEGR